LSYQTNFYCEEQTESSLGLLDFAFGLTPSDVAKKKPAVRDAGFVTDRFWPSVYNRNGSIASKLPCSAMERPRLLTIKFDRKNIIEI
jgi:hypothetical protein